MKKIIFAFIITSSVCVADSCKYPPFVEIFYPIYYKNNTDTVVSFGYSLLYPDTSIVHMQRYQITAVSPKKTSSIDNSSKDWADIINQDIPGKKLQVFVFSVLVNDTNWPTVRDNYLVKKRYEITADQLKTMNYTIAYL